MDLELTEAGETEIDFAVGDENADGLDVDLGFPSDESGDSADGLDFDLSEGADPTMESPTVDIMAMGTETLGISDDAETMESPAVDIDFADFGGDDEATMESPTVESPFVPDDDLDDAASTMETPTIESPLMEHTVESPTLDTLGAGGETAEMPAMEDELLADPTSLDVDLSGLTDLPIADDEFDAASADDEAEGLSEDIFSGLGEESLATATEDDAPAFVDDENRLSPETENLAVGGEDETVFASLEELGKVAGDTDDSFADPEAEAGAPDLADATAEQPAFAAGDTVEQPDLSAGDTVEQPDADSHGTADTAMHAQPGIDLDMAFDSDSIDSEDEPLLADGSASIPDDATMTEVGTKLDLARAYIDMGDPDGARSILEEVLDEGGEGQQQEARQLLDELSA